MTRDESFYANVRQANAEVWNSLHKLKSLQDEYNALDYANTLSAGSGDNAGLTAVELAAVVFDTTNAMFTVLSTGHATNMAKLL